MRLYTGLEYVYKFVDSLRDVELLLGSFTAVSCDFLSATRIVKQRRQGVRDGFRVVRFNQNSVVSVRD
jgi:hypothetical protein